MSTRLGVLGRIRKWFRRGVPLVADEGGPARSLYAYDTSSCDAAALTDEERDALTLHRPEGTDTDDADDAGDADDACDEYAQDDVDVRIVGQVEVQTHEEAADQADTDDEPLTSQVWDPEPEDVALSVPSDRDDRLVEGMQHVADLLSAVRNGISSQQERQQELLDKFEHLPEFLAELPETGKAQLTVLESLEQEVCRAGQVNTDLALHLKRLPELLEAIPEMVSSQSTLLHGMAERLSDQSRQGEQVATSLDATRLCLGQVAATSERQVRCLASMEQAHQRNVEMLSDAMQDQGRRTAALLATAVGIGVVTLAGVLYLATLISRAGLLGP